MNEEEHNRIVQALNEAHTSEVARLQFDIERLTNAHVPLQQQIDELTAKLSQSTAVVEQIRSIVQ